MAVLSTSVNSLDRQGSHCLFLKEEQSVGLDQGEGLGGSFPAEVFRLGPLNLVAKLPENYFHQPGMLSPQSTHHEIIGRLHGLDIGIVYQRKGRRDPRGHVDLYQFCERRARKGLVKQGQVLPAADRRIPIGHNLEDIAQENIPAGPQQLQRLGNGFVQPHEQKTFTEEQQVVTPVCLEIFKSAVEERGPGAERFLSNGRQEGIGRHTIDLILAVEQFSSRVAGAAPDIQN